MLLCGIIICSVLATAGACLGSGVGLHWIWLIPAVLLGSFVVLVALAFLFLLICTKLVNTKKPQEKDSRFYRGLIYTYACLVKTVARVRVHTKGLEKTPKSGRFMLVCNHLHEADPVLLLKYFRKSQLAFITKKEVENMFLIGSLMHKIMCQALDRENDREALKTILNCIRLIKEDKVSIAVFPEGYIKPDRKLHHFRSGVFKIATKAKVPIVVCTITNTNHILGNFAHLRPTDVDLHLVKTIQPEEYADMSTVEIADMVYNLMAEDLGPDRVSQEENS